MELIRKITKEFDIWLKGKEGLIVYGARQVGKTYIIKKYLKQNFKKVYYLNLHDNLYAITSIIKANNINTFLSILSLLSDVDIDNDTCIFIDEIQEYYTYLSKHPEIEQYFDIIYHTKTFASEGKNRIVLSGSLLRLEMENLITAPVGYLLKLEMFPLDFEEYLINSNINENIISIVRECVRSNREVPDYIHKKFIDLFNEYILVGGMPSAVALFKENKNFKELRYEHAKIEGILVDDITKYALDNDKLKVREIYDLIPTELSNPTRKFILSDIPGHNKNNNEVLSFSWLNKAGISIPCYLTSEPLIPLIANLKRNQFKLFFEDVGLLSYRMFNNETKLAIFNNEISVNLGFIFENFVAQELHAHEYDNIYYYNSRKYGEVDFVIENGFKVLPIEVKSGRNNNYHRALNSIMNIDNYSLDKAYVLSHENVRVEGKIIYCPIYAVSFLEISKKM